LARPEVNREPPLFTVLLPVNRLPVLLPFAVDSVLAQELDDFELFIICEGAPPETERRARELAATDRRIRVFDLEKGKRLGESLREAVLNHATSRFVAQIGDDDLWFSGYLREMAKLLEDVDFGNLIQTEIDRDGTIRAFPGSLANPMTRKRMLDTRWNFFGPSFGGYKLASYRKLQGGWGAAPGDLWTDLFMWRKFLARDDFTFGTHHVVEGVKLSAADRQKMTIEEREIELRALARRFSDPNQVLWFRHMAFRSISDQLRPNLAASLGAIDATLADIAGHVSQS
jgi:glycosyltransferase involved in cell wall biosynthesis